MLSKRSIGVALAVWGGLAATAATAATITWDFSSNGWTETSAGTWGNTRYATSSGVQATASAWSNTTDGAAGANTVIQNAYLGLYGGGVGVTNRDGATATSSTCGGIAGGGDYCEGTPTNTISPEHAVDSNQRYDSVRIRFTTAVNLTSILLGYVDTDSDVTILASNGAALSGRTYGGATGLVAAGWSVVGNFSNVAQNVVTSIASSTYATDWLILAYNPAFGETWTAGNDYFKLQALTTYSGTVPEPGTLLLLGGMALAGIWSGRRAKRR